MKTWKHYIIGFLVIITLAFTFFACDDGSNSTNGNGNNNSDAKGGTLVVNNGTPYNYTVTITFDNVEVFNGTLTTLQDIRRTSNKDVEWKIVYVRQYPYQNSKIGSLAGGQTIYYNLGE